MRSLHFVSLAAAALLFWTSSPVSAQVTMFDSKHPLCQIADPNNLNVYGTPTAETGHSTTFSGTSLDFKSPGGGTYFHRSRDSDPNLYDAMYHLAQDFRQGTITLHNENAHGRDYYYHIRYRNADSKGKAVGLEYAVDYYVFDDSQCRVSFKGVITGISTVELTD